MSLTGFVFGSHVPEPAPIPEAAANALIDGYRSWRAACSDAEAAYQRWASCESADRGLAFAAHLAALDHEEHAARVYERHCRPVLCCEDPAPIGARRTVR